MTTPDHPRVDPARRRSRGILSRMKLLTTISAATVVSAIAGLRAPDAPAAETPAATPLPAPQDPVRAPADAQEEWRRALHYAMPGAEHAELAALSGPWAVDVTVTYPGRETQKSTAVAEIEATLGSRFLVERIEGVMQEQAFEGLGVIGYDRIMKAYVMNWMDTFGTMIHLARGKRDDNGVINLRGLRTNHITPNGQPFRTAIEIVRGDERAQTRIIKKMYETLDNKEVLVMEMQYRRRNANAR